MTRSNPHRRTFLMASGLGLGSAALGSWARALGGSPNEQVTVGVMGCSRNSAGGDGRGSALARQLAGLPGANVAYVCDVDERNIGKAAESVATSQERAPKGVSDFRRILDDDSVDALVVATPNHWHAPAAILASAAGKHVYVEKPCSHNPHEGELLVAAAKKSGRVMQHGTQRRSWPGVQEAIGRIQEGVIGTPRLAETWYFADRPAIGTAQPEATPEWLDWSLWQGPAPEQPFRSNVVHYNWHWFWHWGNGEVGNNGVHFIDVARWGLGLGLPRRVVSAGGFSRRDDQQTPDTNIVTAEYDEASILFYGKSWARRPATSPAYDIVFHGDRGTLAIRGGGYTVFDTAGKEIDKGSGGGGDRDHLQNFVDAVRGSAKLNAPITEGHLSTQICHLANIAFRTGGAVTLDAETGRLAKDSAGHELWQREYRPGWEPQV